MVSRKFLTGNQLKLIAMAAMTCDHVGLQLLPQYPLLRIIGRLALPIYAYMIGEGCRYTRDRRRYLLSIAVLALVCQVVFWFASASLYQSILVTFSLSICLIYALDRALRGNWLPAAICSLSVLFLSVVLPQLLPAHLNYGIDYGIWGILLPVAVYFAPDRAKLAALSIALLPLCIGQGGAQWYCYLAVILLLFYNGKRGKTPMKNLFYIYYPAHLAIIYLISIIV